MSIVVAILPPAASSRLRPNATRLVGYGVMQVSTNYIEGRRGREFPRLNEFATVECGRSEKVISLEVLQWFHKRVLIAGKIAQLNV